MIYSEKSQPAPDCLSLEKTKANGSYNCGDVLERLQNDFKNKCYICEDKAPHSINIEHFRPHRGDKDLKFDWNNLFYCCSHCNNTKLAKAAFDDILNCTVEMEIDKRIKYSLYPSPKEKAIISAVEENDTVNNTVSLLNEVYNGTTTMKRMESANLRTNLLKEIRRFNDLLFEYDDDSYNAEEKEDFKNQIIRHLRPSSSFTAFKKWILRENEYLREDFLEYL